MNGQDWPHVGAGERFLRGGRPGGGKTLDARQKGDYLLRVNYLEAAFTVVHGDRKGGFKCRGCNAFQSRWTRAVLAAPACSPWSHDFAAFLRETDVVTRGMPSLRVRWCATCVIRLPGFEQAFAAFLRMQSAVAR